MRLRKGLVGHRRSFFMRDLGGCVMWIPEHGTAVGTDCSGNGKHWTQAVPGNRGTLVPNGLNGQTTLALTEAGSQYMNHTLDLAPPCTFAFVAKTNHVGANYSAIYAGGGLFVYAAADGVTNWGVYAQAQVNSGAQLNAFKACIVVARSYSDMDFWTNGVKVLNNGNGIGAYGPGHWIGQGGGGQFLDGEIAPHPAAFNRAIAQHEVDRINSFYRTTFALF